MAGHSHASSPSQYLRVPDLSFVGEQAALPEEVTQYLAKRVMPVLEAAMIDKQRETVRLPVRPLAHVIYWCDYRFTQQARAQQGDVVYCRGPGGPASRQQRRVKVHGQASRISVLNCIDKQLETVRLLVRLYQSLLLMAGRRASHS